MSTLAPTQPVRALTPTNLTEEERGIWEYAVPLDGNEVSFSRLFVHGPAWMEILLA